jgi:hypothetical protein
VLEIVRLRADEHWCDWDRRGREIIRARFWFCKGDENWCDCDSDWCEWDCCDCEWDWCDSDCDCEWDWCDSDCDCDWYVQSHSKIQNPKSLANA